MSYFLNQHNNLMEELRDVQKAGLDAFSKEELFAHFCNRLRREAESDLGRHNLTEEVNHLNKQIGDLKAVIEGISSLVSLGKRV